MRSLITNVIFGLSLMLWVGGSAVADDMVPIRIYNDGSDDIVVTVFDMNASPPVTALENQRINGFAWIPLSVTAGADGNGHVKWTARSAEQSFHRCGHRNVEALGSEDPVRVSVNSRCARPAS